jgi:hypothetical protein
MRAEGHAVESICRVLREQGCQVAAGPPGQLRRAGLGLRLPDSIAHSVDHPRVGDGPGCDPATGLPPRPVGPRQRRATNGGHDPTIHPASPRGLLEQVAWKRARPVLRRPRRRNAPGLPDDSEFTALRYFTLDGSDYPSHTAQETAIAGYVRWRSKHAQPNDTAPSTPRSADPITYPTLLDEALAPAGRLSLDSRFAGVSGDAALRIVGEPRDFTRLAGRCACRRCRVPTLSRDAAGSPV